MSILQETIPTPTLEVTWCTFKQAEYACKNWHYSRSVPIGKMVKIGAFEDGHFVGCVLFSYGTGRNLAQQYGLKQTELCELTRIALTKHAAPVTQIMARAIKMLKILCPKMRLIVSYADTEQSHVGTIYQANNWIYTGAVKSTDSLLVNGKIKHSRSVSMMYGTSAVEKLKAIGLDVGKVKKGCKHKYLMPLDKNMQKQVSVLNKPYPKHILTPDS